ncbi:MAG: polyphosphate polymerase domain-containing protein [Peptococcaceae bacterium]|nr:polyphosphate polymerase domain-containing protein [Peptococcaceae bacterium]
MIDHAQYEALAACLAAKTAPDRYGAYLVSNLYYDTDQFDLIRASLEKPLYKEKLRLRCYGKADKDTPVFLELKKKYQGVVYKRRIKLAYKETKHIAARGIPQRSDSLQVSREIAYFLTQYPVTEKVFLCYDRLALTGVEDKGLRLTFDTNIRFRQTELGLENAPWGTNILEPGKVLMEIKTPGAIPLWLSRTLSASGIFPVSFSKYGTCYSEFMRQDSGQEPRRERQVMASA